MAAGDLAKVEFSIEMMPSHMQIKLEDKVSSYTPQPGEYWWYKRMECGVGNTQLIPIDDALFEIADSGVHNIYVEPLDMVKFLYIENMGLGLVYVNFADETGSLVAQADSIKIPSTQSWFGVINSTAHDKVRIHSVVDDNEIVACAVIKKFT